MVITWRSLVHGWRDIELPVRQNHQHGRARRNREQRRTVHLHAAKRNSETIASHMHGAIGTVIVLALAVVSGVLVMLLWLFSGRIVRRVHLMSGMHGGSMRLG